MLHWLHPHLMGWKLHLRTPRYGIKSISIANAGHDDTASMNRIVPAQVRWAHPHSVRSTLNSQQGTLQFMGWRMGRGVIADWIGGSQKRTRLSEWPRGSKILSCRLCSLRGTNVM